MRMNFKGEIREWRKKATRSAKLWMGVSAILWTLLVSSFMGRDFLNFFFS